MMLKISNRCLTVPHSGQTHSRLHLKTVWYYQMYCTCLLEDPKWHHHSPLLVLYYKFNRVIWMKDKRHFSGHNYTAVWFRRGLKKTKELDLKITIFKSVCFSEHSVEAVPMFGLLVTSSPRLIHLDVTHTTLKASLSPSRTETLASW